MERINCVFDDKDFGFAKGTAKYQSDEIFKDYKPIRDANKRFNTLAEENAKRALQSIDPKKEAHAQRMGRLYTTGSDSDLVKCDLDRRGRREMKKKKSTNAYTMANSFPILPGQSEDGGADVVNDSARIFSTTQSLLHSTKPKHTFPAKLQSTVDYNPHSKPDWDQKYHSHANSTTTSTMRMSTALYQMDRLPGGKYRVSTTLAPYDEQFRGEPQQSNFTSTTPMMWDIDGKKAANRASAEGVLNHDIPYSSHACSKSKLVKQIYKTMLENAGDVSLRRDGSSCSESGMSSVGTGPVLEQGWARPSAHRSTYTSQSSEQVGLYGESVGEGVDVDETSSSSESRPGVFQLDRTYGESDLSALQHTLISCGRLRVVDNRHTQPIQEHVNKALVTGVKHGKSHAKWLQKNKKGNYIQRPDFTHRRKNGGSRAPTDSNYGPDAASVTTMPTYSESGSYGRFAESAPGGGLAKRHPATKKDALRLIESKQTYAQRAGDRNTRLHSKSHGVDNVKKGSALEDHSSVLIGNERGASVSKSTNDGGSSIHRLEDGTGGDQRGRNDIPCYDDSLAAHLDVTTVSGSGNPFRVSNRDASRLKFSAAQSVQSLHSKHVDPKSYSDAMYKTQCGSYNAMIREPVVGGVPCKENITKALVQISRRVLVSYDTKIVETGAALRALQDLRHSTPGIAAIIDLNRAFSTAAAFNPSPWQLSRSQFEAVMQDKLPWFEKDAISRLASAYDPHRSGVIKYVRVTAALMVGNRPAMSVLMSQLTRDPDNVDKSGNVFLIRLLHGLYEDCAGGVSESAVSALENESDGKIALNIAKPEGAGMKLEDVPEAFCACCCSVDDEIRIKEMADEVVQVLFEDGQRNIHASNGSSTTQAPRTSHTRSVRRDQLLFGTGGGDSSSLSTKSSIEGRNASSLRYSQPPLGGDRALAKVVLKHQTLRGVMDIPKITQNDLVRAMTTHPYIMAEFGQQLMRFRELMLPYIVKGTITYEESLRANSTYGSKSMLGHSSSTTSYHGDGSTISRQGISHSH